MPSDVDDFWKGMQEDLESARQMAAPYLDVVHSVNGAGNGIRLKDGGAGAGTSELFPRVAGGPIIAGDTVVVARRSNGKRLVIGKLDDGVGDALATAAALSTLEGTVTSGLAGKSSSTHKHNLGAFIGTVNVTRDPGAGGTFNNTGATGAIISSLSGNITGLTAGANYVVIAASGAWIAPATAGNAVYMNVRVAAQASAFSGHNSGSGSWVNSMLYAFQSADGSGNISVAAYAKNNVSANNPISGGYIWAVAMPYIISGPV